MTIITRDLISFTACLHFFAHCPEHAWPHTFIWHFLALSSFGLAGRAPVR